jgi:hypothetical protein
MQPSNHLKAAVKLKLFFLKKTMVDVCKPHKIDPSNLHKFLDGRVNSEKAVREREIVIQDIGLTEDDVEQVKAMAEKS